jgi:nicotinate-nucleotide adenylyltransferase
MPQRPTPGSDSRRIALFGGSFDPPHLGHVLCATYAYLVGGVDAVWVLPVHHHPYGKDLASWEHRWAMCQATFGGLGFIELRDDEQRNSDGRTYDLIARLQREHPGLRFCLIGGTDTRADLGNWYRGSELLAQVDIIAVPRRGFDDQHPAALPAISSTAIRRRLEHSASLDGLLAPDVLAYIQQHGLYRPA